MPESAGLPKRAVVARTLPCRGCGYNLRGSRIEGDCPECGRPVVDSIERALDPDAPKLPQLRNPRAVGNALVALLLLQTMTLAFAVTGPILNTVVGMVEGTLDQVPGAATPSGRALLIGAAGSFLAAFASVLLAVAKGAEGDARVRRSIIMIVAGHVAAGAFLILGWCALDRWVIEDRGVLLRDALLEQTALVLGLVLSAVVILLGVAGVLASIGERSRTYREATIARQGIRGMVVACVLAAAGTVAVAIAGQRTEGAWSNVEVVAQFVVIASVVMLLIGMLYLVLNAVWIRNGIRHPAGRLGELVRIEPDSVYLASISRGSKSESDGGGSRGP